MLPLVNFADALDTTVALGPGDPVPLLWHWFAFTPSFPQSLLEDDGHPSEAPTVPAFPNRRRMMVGGRINHTEPMRIGEVYVRHTEVTDHVLTEGRSGRMLLVTVQHTFRNETGSTVAIEEEKVAYRQQSPGQPRQLRRPETVPSPWHAQDPGGVVISTDSRLLFRFSALTYNTHRIHYDEPYASAVEGYPALVVHGPLLALLMLEKARRAGATPSGFEYRLRAPSYCGDVIIAVCRDLETVVGTLGRESPAGDGRVLAWYHV